MQEKLTDYQRIMKLMRTREWWTTREIMEALNITNQRRVSSKLSNAKACLYVENVEIKRNKARWRLTEKGKKYKIQGEHRDKEETKDDAIIRFNQLAQRWLFQWQK